MPLLDANGIRLEVESMGAADAPAVLLVMGLGMQLVAWPDSLCRELVRSGYRVIRFDNRDVGLSEKWQGTGSANLPLATMRYLLRLPVAAPYRVETMAADAVGVLDALGIGAAHIVGASLGGMIAQSLAAARPERCLSLVSIMSSSGDRSLPPADLKVLRLMLNRPRASARPDELLEHYVRLFQVIGSPGFPTPLEEMRARLRVGIERSHYPEGTARQILAILASGDRSTDLGRIAAPTLVLHGDADPLVPVKHGIDCARKIPGARLQLVPGMGHDLAPGLLPILSAALLEHFAASRPASSTRH
jgi:pimeloyl-ACP methyl ester carboxylesterase